jgi:hypothetical protein
MRTVQSYAAMVKTGTVEDSSQLVSGWLPVVHWVSWCDSRGRRNGELR